MYQRVYKKEEETSTIDCATRMGGVSLNRGFTNGKVSARSRRCGGKLTTLPQYCISMHDLEDLILHTGYYNEETRKMDLGIDS